MTRIGLLALSAALLALPPIAHAQAETPPAPPEDGFNLIDEGAKLLLRGLQDEMKPMMEDLATEMAPKLQQFAAELLPMLEAFSDLVGDLDAYQPPEKLPNGDIILRRKVPLAPDAPDGDAGGAAKEGEIDL